MNLIFLLFTGISIGFSGAMIPGPLTLFTISSALKSNKSAGLKIILGHICLELIFILFIFLGLQRLLDSERFLLMVSVIGGIALIIMGIIILFNASSMKISDARNETGFNPSQKSAGGDKCTMSSARQGASASSPRGSAQGLFMGGIFFSMISPGFLAWWATIGISTVTKAILLGITGLIFLTLGHWLADIAWYWSLSYAVDRGKMYLSNKAFQNIMRVLSILLIVLGLHFLIVNH